MIPHNNINRTINKISMSKMAKAASKKYFAIYFSILLLVIMICIPLVVADGGFFPRNTYYTEDLYEPTQKAIIIHDGINEQLIIEATYNGNMSDFAWIVPVPEYPTVERTSPYLFEELHYLTQPDYRRSLSRGLGMSNFAESGALQKDVNVLEQKQVGVYETTILSSDDPKALVDWLTNNQYYISPDSKSVLEYYIDKNYYFIAARINLAPYDEKLLTSLKNINPSITSIDDANSLLTNQLMSNVKSKQQYYTLKNVSSTILNYDNDTDELINGQYPLMNSRPDYNSKPKYLITESEYTLLYENYNGYLYDHMLRSINTVIQQKFMDDNAYPDYYSCNYPGNNPKTDYSKCNIWKYDREDPEYKILEGAECGDYCNLISASKSEFSIEDISKVAAYAIVNGDDDLAFYFSIDTESGSWYNTQEDKERQIIYQISNNLQNDKQDIKNTLEAESRNVWIKKYAQLTGAQESENGVISYLTTKIYNDFTSNKPYIESYAYDLELMSMDKYNELKYKYEGNHNDNLLRTALQNKVDSVLNWKQNTVTRSLGTGNLQPLSIKFTSKDIVYPLKISSINKGVSEVLLYVFAPYKTQIDNVEGFELEYAKWIEKEDIQNNDYETYEKRIKSMNANNVDEMMIYRYYYPKTYYYTNQLLDDRYFLTKFRAELWPREMEDVQIVQAPNNAKYKLVVYQSGYWTSIIVTIVWLIISAAILFGIVLLCALINTLIVKDKESAFFVSRKRSIVYAAVLPIIIFIALISETFRYVLGNLLESYAQLFEFFWNLFHYLHFPEFIGMLFMAIIATLLTFYIVHLIASIFVMAWKNINNYGISGIVEWKVALKLGIFTAVATLILLLIIYILAGATLNKESMLTIIVITLVATATIIIPYIIWNILLPRMKK